MKQHIHKLIQQKGSLTIAEFVAEALAHPEFGYYIKQNPLGKGGDFTTAPEISQIFGELIGIWCVSVWQQTDKPDMQLIELGPGRGTLMSDLLRGTRHVAGFHDAINIHMVETSPALTEIQQEALKDSHKNITWHKDISLLPKSPSIIIANEFFDALPINQYEKRQGSWYENNVSLQDGKLVFSLSDKPATNIDKEHEKATDGSVVEICPSGLSIMRELSERIAKYSGAAVIIDYGYTESGYKDTLQAVKNHKYHPVLADVGDADITAHIDFSALCDVAKKVWIKNVNIVTQREFLLSLGLKIRERQLLQKASKEQAERIVSGNNRLISEDEMGSLFKVLIITGGNADKNNHISQP